MTKMNASLKQLAHRIIGQRHWDSPVMPPQTRGPLPSLAGGGGTTGRHHSYRNETKVRV
jgi:hypothetical protein